MINIELNGGAANAHQTFTMVLSDRNLNFKLDWNTLNEYWSLSVFEGETNIIYNMCLLPNCEISRVDPVDIGGAFFFVGQEPTLDNLGKDNFLIWVEDE